jgi:hypothetical protein
VECENDSRKDRAEEDSEREKNAINAIGR